MLLVLGVNHKSAPIDIREKIAVDKQATLEIIDSVIATKAAEEIVLISTCNRTELYVWTSSYYSILRWLKVNWLENINDWRSHGYIFTDRHAAKHLMRVASGLDSMVLGEAEILGQ